MPSRTWLSLTVLAGLSLPCAADSAPQAAPLLGVPIDCALGHSCFIQQYADHDLGPGASDYRCSVRTYDGHDGTDIRVPSLAVAKRGVRIIAAAAGIVRGARDGMPDGSLSGPGTGVAGRECGNGVVLMHPGGRETQYCHMAAHSITVSVGQEVAAGQTLGRVGLSGDTAFPHLHFSVRDGGREIDPFDPVAKCGSKVPGLWTPAARAALEYGRSDLLNAGFAGDEVTRDQIENERVSVAAVQSNALVAYVRLIGLQAGDVLTLVLTAPDGTILVRSDRTMDRNKAEWISFAGSRRFTGHWPKGRYVAAVTLTSSSSSIILRRSFTTFL